MRPLAVLLGIVMGSTVAIALGLAMVLIIFMILGSDYSQLETERAPLLRSLALFVPLSAVAAAGFYGELRRRQWRWGALTALGLGVLIAVWMYWPREV